MDWSRCPDSEARIQQEMILSFRESEKIPFLLKVKGEKIVVSYRLIYFTPSFEVLKENLKILFVFSSKNRNKLLFTSHFS